MNYSETIDYLFGLSNVGIKLGLRRIRVLLEALGSPERRMRTILVAGTNGKGSAVAMIHAVLSAAGLRTGRYTSPHIIDFEERIVAGHQPIPRDEVARIATRLRELVQSLVERGALESHPTYFELVTAMALAHFAAQGMDAAVLEVGLGGRFDATNAADPDISVITRVALDHTHFLGSTLRQVAFEKAGIIRSRRPVVTSCEPGAALDVIREVAGRCGAELQVASELCRRSAVRPLETGGYRFDLRTPAASYTDLHLPLRGEHQLENAAAVVLALETLARQGLPVDEARIREGLSSVSWPGRLELVPGSPPLLFDCAHNPDGTRSLADYLDREVSRPVTLLFGVMGDKDVGEMTSRLFPRALRVVLTRPEYNRAMEPVEVARIGGRHAAEMHLEPDPRRALELSRRLAGPNGLVLVAGSIFLVSDIKKAAAQPADPSPAEAPAQIAKW
jgi:dihydrofolate synthase/folylpolyglutamate synthase